MKMEEGCTSDMLVRLYRSTRRHKLDGQRRDYHQHSANTNHISQDVWEICWRHLKYRLRFCLHKPITEWISWFLVLSAICLYFYLFCLPLFLLLYLIFLSPSIPHLSCPLSPSSTHYFLLFSSLYLSYLDYQIYHDKDYHITFFYIFRFFCFPFILSSLRTVSSLLPVVPHHILNKSKILKRQLTSWALHIKPFGIFSTEFFLKLRNSWICFGIPSTRFFPSVVSLTELQADVTEE